MLKKLFFLSVLPILSLTAETPDFIQNAIKGLFEQFFSDDSDSEEEFQKTSHSIQLPSGQLEYTAITGVLPIFDDEGTNAGELFFTAYLKDGHDPKRPLTFIFNGGPGGSSLSMHIAGFGPRRLLYPEEGQKTLPPYQLIDNPETILDLTDIIYIDPMHTGYSEAAEPQYKSLFFSVEGDIYSFAEFIRVFCIHFDRWNSPKYLLGASYGTCRACGLSESLMYTAGIYLDGVILLGSALDMNTLVSQRDSYLPDTLSIPTYAATAWYHGRSMQEKTLEEAVDHARRFALENYSAFMLQPSRLTAAEKTAFYQELADLIGLPLSTIQRYQARIDEHTYVSEFMASERKRIGGTDSRYIGDISTLTPQSHEDPSYRNFRPAFYPAFMNYMQNELETTSIFPKYRSFSIEALYTWNWWTYDNFTNLPNFLQRLRRSLITNPHMKVFVGSGYYDIRTPFAAAEYSLDHLDLPSEYRKNFQCEYYEAGHGFIFDIPSLQKLKNDLTRFYAK